MNVEQETTLKRKATILVDPDTKKEVSDPKRPTLILVDRQDTKMKIACLKTIIQGYDKITSKIFHTVFSTIEDKSTEERDRVTAEIYYDIILACQTTSILFTVHNVNRQRTLGTLKADLREEYKLRYRGKDILLSRQDMEEIWLAAATENGLAYVNYNRGDSENWYGTMASYMDTFAAFRSRLEELRLGHKNMPITTKIGTRTSFEVSKYGLHGHHRVLLEGSSFPPERRLSIVQSLGPMTVFLCMLKSEGRIRNKYAAAVKRAMAHIPGINEIIELIKTENMAHEVANFTTILAEIMLFTSCQPTRMFFPINFLWHVWRESKNDEKLLEFFDTSGSGGWYLHKKCCEVKWVLQGNFTEEKASQVIYHSIFGTYKQDFGILSQVTTMSTWMSRVELGDCFKEMTAGRSIWVNLIRQVVYANMSPANHYQRRLLAGDDYQVSTIPCFGGPRIQVFGEDFSDHIQKWRMAGTGIKTESTYDQFHSHPRRHA